MDDSIIDAAREALTARLADACPDSVARIGARVIEILPDGRRFAYRPMQPHAGGAYRRTAEIIEIEDCDLAEGLPGRASLTCLVGLERAMGNALASTMTRLALASGEWLTVALRTRAADSSTPHRTVLHVDAWAALLNAAGWAETRREKLGPETESPGRNGADPIPLHWRRSDPFRDAATGGRWLVVLRRITPWNATESPADVRERLAAVLDRFGLASGIHLQPSSEPTARVGFVIGVPQDYHMLRPLLDAVSPARRVVILRQGLATASALARRAAILAHMESHGYDPIHAADLAQVPWDSLDVMITASESTANSDHLLNASFVIAARARGIHTCQLQHGIVPLADFTSPVVLFSDQFLAWGPDVRLALALTGAERQDSARVLHAANRMDYTITGCPKFDTLASSVRLRPADLFGHWAARFTRMCLIATNLHWSQHRAAGDVWSSVCEMAAGRPAELFVLKMHPVEEPLDVDKRNLPDNLLVLDDRSALDAGLDSTRLIRASDVVICTLSTIALEAALAGRPCIVLSTGNPNTYRGVRLTTLADLPRALEVALQHTPGIAAPREFLDTYYASDIKGTAVQRVLGAIARAPRRRESNAIDPTWLGLAALAETLAGREAHAAALEAAVAEKDVYNRHLQGVIRGRDESRSQLLAAMEQKDRRIAALERELANHGHPLPMVS